MSAQKPRLSPDVPAQLSDLPDSVLVEVATYLPPTTCAIFAVAITASPSSWLQSNWQRPQSSSSRAITDGHWGVGAGLMEEIDVGKDVLRDLRGELSDADLGGMLVCIDAKHTIKSLKLTHCFGISGAGLQPLIGSKVLRRIDLSLVGLHENPTIEGELALDEGVVIRILDSIVSQNDSSLMHIQLPKRWRDNQSLDLSNLLERYAQLLDSHQLTCRALVWNRDETNGSVPCGRPAGSPWILSYANMGCVQGQTCYICLNSFCDDCGGTHCGLRNCLDCEKMLCEDCVSVLYCETGASVAGYAKESCAQCNLVTKCSGCESYHCSDCRPMEECHYCGGVACVEFCFSKCQVEGCNKVSCLACSEDGEIGKAVRNCSTCDSQVCFDCRVQKCRQEGDRISCAECMGIIGPTLLSEYETMREIVSYHKIFGR